MQITARWYDEFERLTDTVSYGTNDASASMTTFDRSGLRVPTRSDTAGDLLLLAALQPTKDQV